MAMYVFGIERTTASRIEQTNETPRASDAYRISVDIAI
jgi:hypothetical protein